MAAAERDAAARAEAERVEAEEEARVAALKKKCGKDYGQVRRGMTWDKRIQECAGPFVLVREDEAGAVYEAQGGLVLQL